MRRPRSVIALCCLLLGVVSLGVPAVALAGGSAGDQQYTDPFGGSSDGGGASTTATAPPATNPTAPDTTTPAAAPAATTPAATTPDPTTPDPTATAAAPTSAPTLPYTGYAAWLAAGFGAVMLGAGLILRWPTRGTH